ncbi:MAG: hypothetical protein ACRD4F_00350, partial [Candidatus Angelobacter sp.]
MGVVKFAQKMTPNKAVPQSARKQVYKPRAEKSGTPPDHFRVRGKHNKMFSPGQPVPETGIYEVIHDRAHRETHEVVMHRGDQFPACDQCDQRVRFKVLRTAPYIFDDEDFVEEP